MKETIFTHTLENLYAGALLKKYIFIIFLGLFTLSAFGNARLASKQEIGMFKNSRTCVVFEDGITFYNAYIKDAVQKYWKSTDYEFIDQSEFDKRRSDSKYSFLVLMDGAYDNDPGGVSYSYISLVLGDGSNNLTRMPELCSIPISYSDDKSADYEYVIPAIVKFIQKHVKNLEKERFFISLKGLKFYNGLADFKDKVLLLNKDGMALYVDTHERINTVYPYYIKLLTTLEIQAELVANPANTLFHFHVGPDESTGAGKCFDMIFDTNGNLCYYNFRKITNENGDGFNLNDFKNIR